jgi:hypothetical protein
MWMVGLSMKYFEKQIVVFCILVSMCNLASCTNVTAQENYAREVNAMVGASVDRLKNNPLSERQLDNGNVEYKYRYNQGCIEIYEVDPRTRIVQKASYEGSSDWCNLSP